MRPAPAHCILDTRNHGNEVHRPTGTFTVRERRLFARYLSRRPIEEREVGAVTEMTRPRTTMVAEPFREERPSARTPVPSASSSRRTHRQVLRPRLALHRMRTSVQTAADALEGGEQPRHNRNALGEHQQTLVLQGLMAMCVLIREAPVLPDQEIYPGP